MLNRQALWACLLVGVGTLSSFAVAATPITSGISRPPESYQVDGLSLQVTRQPGNGDLPLRRITLVGSGSLTLEQPPTTLPYPPRLVVGWANELYGMRFFDLPAQQTTRFSVRLTDTGRVETDLLRMVDSETTRVCFRLPDFEKCVVYQEFEAPELEKLVKRLFLEAQQLSKTPNAR